MKLFATLRQKPWLADAVPAGAEWQPAADAPRAAAETALKFILAIVGVLFFLFVITFLSRSQYPDFQALAGEPWQPFSDTSRLWLNTGILALASISMQLAVFAARREQANRAVLGITLAVFFTLGFLLAQWSLWQQLQAMGFYARSNPATSYFYLLTAVHGLHLLGGTVVLAHAALRGWRDSEPASLAWPLRLCAIYWHFLLGVWLVLFALLTARTDTINALAALCGF